MTFYFYFFLKPGIFCQKHRYQMPTIWSFKLIIHKYDFLITYYLNYALKHSPKKTNQPLFALPFTALLWLTRIRFLRVGLLAGVISTTTKI